MMDIEAEFRHRLITSLEAAEADKEPGLTYLIEHTQGPDLNPVVMVWISIPLTLDQHRGGWVAHPTLPLVRDGGQAQLDIMVREALEALRSERSRYLADPEAFDAAQAASAAQGAPLDAFRL